MIEEQRAAARMAEELAAREAAERQAAAEAERRAAAEAEERERQVGDGGLLWGGVWVCGVWVDGAWCVVWGRVRPVTGSSKQVSGTMAAGLGSRTAEERAPQTDSHGGVVVPPATLAPPVHPMGT